MAIGNWGTVIVFEVSSRKILNFQNLKRSVSGRWKKHSIIGKKPRSEFTGPESLISSLEKAAEKGQIEYLYIGGKKIGSKKMYLESISETWNEVWNNGELVKATVSLTFSEYR